ncbi:MAG: hypothetical protein AB7P04_11360 [Bacteriovoracia bacterium]
MSSMQTPNQKKTLRIVLGCVLAIAFLFGGVMMLKKKTWQAPQDPSSEEGIGQAPVKVIPEGQAPVDTDPSQQANAPMNNAPEESGNNPAGYPVGQAGQAPGTIGQSAQPGAQPGALPPAEKQALGKSGASPEGKPYQVTGVDGRVPASVDKTAPAKGVPLTPSALPKDVLGPIGGLLGPVKVASPGQPGAAGTPGTMTAAPGTPTNVTTAPAVEKIADDCYKMTFKHQKLSSHENGEACTMHRNQFALQGEKINRASVCVRVNGTPVKFEWAKGKGDQVVIAAIAGPKAVITAQYCTGRIMCGEECKVPKDAFMEAIGATDDNGSELPVVQWDAHNPDKKQAKEEATLDQELEGFKKELAEHNPAEAKVFSGWTPDAPNPTCKENQYTGGGAVSKVAAAKEKQ